jgi:hypothetical protein
MHSSSPAGLAQHHRDHGPSAIHTGIAFERVVLLHRHEAIPLVEGHVPSPKLLADMEKTRPNAKNWKKFIQRIPNDAIFKICMGPACRHRGAQKLGTR